MPLINNIIEKADFLFTTAFSQIFFESEILSKYLKNNSFKYMDLLFIIFFASIIFIFMVVYSNNYSKSLEKFVTKTEIRNPKSLSEIPEPINSIIYQTDEWKRMEYIGYSPYRNDYTWRISIPTRKTLKRQKLEPVKELEPVIDPAREIVIKITKTDCKGYMNTSKYRAYKNIKMLFRLLPAIFFVTFILLNGIKHKIPSSFFIQSLDIHNIMIALGSVLLIVLAGLYSVNFLISVLKLRFVEPFFSIIIISLHAFTYYSHPILSIPLFIIYLPLLLDVFYISQPNKEIYTVEHVGCSEEEYRQEMERRRQADIIFAEKEAKERALAEAWAAQERKRKHDYEMNVRMANRMASIRDEIEGRYQRELKRCREEGRSTPPPPSF